MGGKTVVWEGQDVNEVGKDKDSGDVLVKINPKFYRPTEVDLLLGDPSKAVEKLKWQKKYSFEELVKEMVREDVKLMKSNPTA